MMNYTYLIIRLGERPTGHSYYQMKKLIEEGKLKQITSNVYMTSNPAIVRRVKEILKNVKIFLAQEINETFIYPKQNVSTTGASQVSEIVRIKKVLVIHDTDGHGLLSGAVAFRTLTQQGYFVTLAGQFSREGPSTTPYGIVQFLQSVITPQSLKEQGYDEMILLDIPIPAQEPQKFVDVLSEYVKMGIKVTFIDHHGHSEWHKLLAERGITPVIQPTSYDMTMYLPRLYGLDKDPVIQELALMASAFDFDKSVADRITAEQEELIERLDQWLKFKAEQELKMELQYPDIGFQGKLAHYIALVGPSWLWSVAQMQPEIPIVPHEVIQRVVLATEFPPQGLAWKVASKLCRITRTDVAVVPATSPRGYCVIVARYWRAPEEVTKVVEEVVQEFAQGRTVVGHPGARSITVSSGEEAKELARQIAQRLSEKLSSSPELPSSRESKEELIRETLKLMKQLIEKLEKL